MPPMDPSETPQKLPPRTAPTWEVELLISAAAVFAMLQLPGWLDERVLALLPRLDGDWHRGALLAYVYAKVTALILAVTFIVHLALRARWIALVGLDSVYPGGVRTERLRMGPVQRGVEEGLRLPFDQAIDRADNRATIVFAIGVMVATFVIAIMIAVSVAFALTWIVVRALDLPVDVYLASLAVMGLLLVPLLVAGMLDQSRGAALPASGRAHAWLRKIFRTYARVGMGRSSDPLMALLGSRSGEMRILGMLIGVVLLAVVVTVASLIANQLPDRFGNYGFFPRPARMQRLDPAYYDDSRQPGRDDALPFVQSSVVEGPYLRLTVPYRPRVMASAMRASCPAPDADATREQRAAGQLQCLSRLHAVKLDGKPVPGLRYEVTVDARSDRPALLAMIDVRELAPGRHEITIARPAREDLPAARRRADPGVDRIVFWR